MELLQTRIWYGEDYTISILERKENNTNKTEFLGYILEDRVRQIGLKIPARTAIPAGRYEIIINYSNRFKRLMPLLLDVPMFDSIRMHWGNTDKNTDGCLLNGTRRSFDTNYVYDSKIAFEKVFNLLNNTSVEKNYITIVDTINIQGRL